MTGPARPIRFIALTLLLWTAARAMLLWPEHDDPGRSPLPRLAAIRPTAQLVTAMARSAPFAPQPTIPKVRVALTAHAFSWHAPPSRIAGLAPHAVQTALAPLAPVGAPGTGLAPPAPSIRAVQRGPRRISGYGWVFVRSPNGGNGLAESGQLGGSQAGLRLDYALGADPARGLRLSARISAPLAGKGREAAFGIGWKPGAGLPLALTIERRIGLDAAGRDAFAAGVAGGIGAVALPADFRLEAYGQAGMVGLRHRDAYADGAAGALRPVMAVPGASVSAGAGIWGAAQPGVARLDVGPRIRATIDLGGARIGAAVDWRQRIAGDAGPRSGLAITLDGSF